MKSTPSVVTKLTNGATGTSVAEMVFFRDLRGQLGDLEIPHGFRTAVDTRSHRSIHLMEDLAATKGANFPSAATTLTRAQAEQALDLLAAVHRTFQGRELPHVKTYPQWWRTNFGFADVGKAVERYLDSEHCPERLRAHRHSVWDAAIVSIESHPRLDKTLLHGDPHLGNWYLTENENPGLLDWQCVSAGHWSRDVAYALTTLLTVEQRRAWERDLLNRYRHAAHLDTPTEELFLHYRRQVICGLLMWAPTLLPPKGFPNMQPRELAVEMLHRISTAILDLKVFDD